MDRASRRSAGEPEASERRLFAPCRASCPAHVDVPGYLLAVAEGRFTDALEIVVEHNPLPSVCGRVCLRPCEEGCRRCLLDEPVAIAHLKRAAADLGAYPRPLRPKRMRAERVAVVGGGPAGLTAAHDLAVHGFGATIFDEHERLGGMMRYGIPMYRLPDYALDRDIAFILGHGVESRTGVRVGRDVTIDELRSEYDAVLLAPGLQVSRVPPIPGADLPQVTTALPFLDRVARGERPEVGERVVVVGGGNVAMDVARTVRRLGCDDIYVVCLESREQMPASELEIFEAEMEGIHIRPSWGPRAVLGTDAVTGLATVRCVSVFDAEDRFSPVYDESVEDVFGADTVIFAIGQAVDAADLGVPLTRRGSLAYDAESMRAEADGVYAAGDAVRGPSKIIDAIAEGHRAAAVILRDLTGNSQPLRDLDEKSEALGKVPDHMASRLESRRRIQMERLEYYEAVDSFEEIEIGYTDFEAAREAQRCLACTTGARLTREKCARCLMCMRVCPHDVPSLKAGGYLYFDLDACHACGACVSQCPALALSLEGSSEHEVSLRIQRALGTAGMDTTLVFRCSCVPADFTDLAPDTRVLNYSCLLRVSERSVLEALEEGAARVVFSACAGEECRFPHAKPLIEQREERIRAIMREVGMEGAFEVVEREPEGPGYMP